MYHVKRNGRNGVASYDASGTLMVFRVEPLVR